MCTLMVQISSPQQPRQQQAQQNLCGHMTLKLHLPCLLTAVNNLRCCSCAYNHYHTRTLLISLFYIQCCCLGNRLYKAMSILGRGEGRGLAYILLSSVKSSTVNFQLAVHELNFKISQSNLQKANKTVHKTVHKTVSGPRKTCSTIACEHLGVWLLRSLNKNKNKTV